jgi:hypothetical protein
MIARPRVLSIAGVYVLGAVTPGLLFIMVALAMAYPYEVATFGVSAAVVLLVIQMPRVVFGALIILAFSLASVGRWLESAGRWLEAAAEGPSRHIARRNRLRHSRSDDDSKYQA